MAFVTARMISANNTREIAKQCHDAQHQFEDTTRQQRQQLVRHVAPAMAGTAAAMAVDTAVATARLTLLVVVAAIAAVAGPAAAAVQGRVGRVPVRPFRTRPLRWCP